LEERSLFDRANFYIYLRGLTSTFSAGGQLVFTGRQNILGLISDKGRLRIGGEILV